MIKLIKPGIKTSRRTFPFACLQVFANTANVGILVWHPCGIIPDSYAAGNILILAPSTYISGRGVTINATLQLNDYLLRKMFR